jgi:hypothetical protein
MLSLKALKLRPCRLGSNGFEEGIVKIIFRLPICPSKTSFFKPAYIAPIIFGSADMDESCGTDPRTLDMFARKHS